MSLVVLVAVHLNEKSFTRYVLYLACLGRYVLMCYGGVPMPMPRPPL
jgi:hypothetical protein